MHTKLTLRIDGELVRRAKIFAGKHNKTVSQIVADYFALLGDTDGEETDITPIVRSQKGFLKEEDLDLEGYHHYLAKKYLELSQLNEAVSVGIEQAERGEFSNRSVQDIIKDKETGK